MTAHSRCGFADNPCALVNPMFRASQAGSTQSRFETGRILTSLTPYASPCLPLLPLLWNPVRARRVGFSCRVIAPFRGESPILKKRARIEASTTPTRREPRIQHLSELRMSYESGGECEIPIRPPDLSPHGMFVNTSTHFPEGAVVNLRFRLTKSNVEVQTRCEVRYCLPGIGIGVEFVGLGAKAVRAIERKLKAFSRSRHPKKK